MTQITTVSKNDTPVISPLANEKTYGERWYTRIFDWGLNYWVNLFASAAFSQWVENGTRRIRLPFVEPASPRELQQKLAQWFKKSPFMRGMSAEVAAERSMARARALTLLLPGFLVMIPSVWLGAKIKPMFVEWLNRRHYGDEAMDDPSLQARHQAIRAEDQPTFLGAFTARVGTFFAAQATAQLVGSDRNILNKLGEKTNSKFLREVAVDPVAKKIGNVLGEAVPLSIQQRSNRFAERIGLDWSKEQQTVEGLRGPYTKAAQDFIKYVSLDTIYTLVTAGTIRPFMKLLRHLPFMSYKPKVAVNSPTFDGEKIRVPANQYTDSTPEAEIRTQDADRENERDSTMSAKGINADKPSAQVNQVRERAPMTSREQMIV